MEPLEAVVSDAVDVEVSQAQRDQAVQVHEGLCRDRGQVALFKRELLQAAEAVKRPVGYEDKVIIPNLQRAQVVEVLEHVVQQNYDLIFTDVQLC